MARDGSFWAQTISSIVHSPAIIPESKEDRPFLWGEHEYVIDICADYVFLANAFNNFMGK